MKRFAPTRRLELEPHRKAAPKTAEHRNSPETICVICLDTIQSKCYLNNCLHQFCFACLEKWSEVKSVCPLCQQNFEYALHNVRSDKDYDMHVFSNVDVDSSPFRSGDFERIPVPERQNEIEDDNSYVPTHIIMVDFRQYVYQHGLLSMPVRGNSRKAACTPQYIRSHQQQMRLRLIPWLNRELGVVISIARTQLTIAIERVLSVSSQWHMLSSEFRSEVQFCAKEKSDLFSWELYNFAASFCSMVQYDDEVKYVVPSDLDVPSHYRQFCASVGTTNPMLSLVRPSLALSPTVQSPVRSVSSPVGSIADLSQTDSDDDPTVSLHFKTIRHRRDGVEPDSFLDKQTAREQATRHAKFYAPLGGWSSDTSDYNSENTSTARVQRKQKKVKKIKSSKDLLHEMDKKIKNAIKKQRKRNKGGRRSISRQDGQKATSSTRTPSLDGAGNSNFCMQNCCEVENPTILSRSVNDASAPDISMHANRIREDSSSEGSDVHSLSLYRRRCMYEAPVSYYHGGFVPISDVQDGSVGHSVSCRLSAGECYGKKRLSSVVVKPTVR